MLGRLGIDSVVYGVSALAVRGLQILLIPIYSQVLSPGEYGVVETVAILGALVNLTVALEISQGMARYIADSPDESASRIYASTALAFAAAAYAAFALVVLAFAADLTQVFFAGQTSSLTLELAAMAIAVNGVFVIFQDLLRWQLRPGSYLAASLAYAVGSAGVGVWLVSVESIGVVGVFWGQLVGALLGVTVSLSRSHDQLIILFDMQRLGAMLRYSLPLVVSGAAVFGSLFIDRIVVRELLGMDALGIYGLTARFASVISILAIGLQVALSPLVFRNWREAGAGEALGRICRYYCAAMVPLVGFISLFASEIMTIFTGPTFYPGSNILPLLTLGAMFSTLYVFAPGLFLGERTGHVALLNISGALVNLILSITLISWLGLSGAAVSTAITACFIFFGHIFFGRKWFKVDYDAVKITTSLVIMVVVVLIGVILQFEATSWSLSRTVFKLVLLMLSTIAAYQLALNDDDRSLMLQRFIKRRN
jgi:O-antigen/teichoic acid export membrane protein